MHCASQRSGFAFSVLFERFVGKRIQSSSGDVRSDLIVPRVRIERDEPLAKAREFFRPKRGDLLLNGFNFAHATILPDARIGT